MYPIPIQPEEEMAGASMAVTGEWEFKVLRGCFRGDRLQRALDHEQTFGWELHEKLDDARVRLRRRVEERLVDARREGDPYRSYEPVATAGAVAAAVLLAITAVAGVAAAVIAS